MKTALLALALLAGVGMAAHADDNADVYGTIVSIRGGILQVRPTLRPKLTRASFSDRTEVLSYRRTTKEFLKPGMHVAMGGKLNDKDGFQPFYVVAATELIGELKTNGDGLKPGDNGFANGSGILKSVDPLVFTDGAGKDYTAHTDNLHGYWELYRGDRNTLLIGTRMDLTGPVAPDGVIQAETITVDRDYAAVGTMFGTIVGVDGRTLHVRPRYTQDVIDVIVDDKATIQQEVHIDPDSIRVGDPVTFWAQRVANPGAEDELHPVALLLGDGRYPAATEGDEAAAYISGTLTSLEPVRVRLADKSTLHVVIPAQMGTVRLVARDASVLKSGAPVMLVLRRADGDKFTTASVIVDASPFVGYGG